MTIIKYRCKTCGAEDHTNSNRLLKCGNNRGKTWYQVHSQYPHEVELV